MAFRKLKPVAVEKQLRKLQGNIAAVARSFGVTRQSVQSFISRRPKLQVVVKECRESMKDNAESKLYDAVSKGQAWAICFYLKTQAKDRGYVERQEIQKVGDEELDAEIERELAKMGERRQTSNASQDSVSKPLDSTAGTANDSISSL